MRLPCLDRLPRLSEHIQTLAVGKTPDLIRHHHAGDGD